MVIERRVTSGCWMYSAELLGACSTVYRRVHILVWMIYLEHFFCRCVPFIYPSRGSRWFKSTRGEWMNRYSKVMARRPDTVNSRKRPWISSWRPSTIERILVNSGIIENMDDADSTAVTETWLDDGGRTILLESIICTVFEDGLSRIGSHRVYNTTGKTPSSWPLRHILASRTSITQ